MFNNNSSKYKVHILTTLNNNNKNSNIVQRNFKEKKIYDENKFIFQFIDNLKEIIENNLSYQLKSFENKQFQCLLKYIYQLLITFQNQISGFCLNINKNQ